MRTRTLVLVSPVLVSLALAPAPAAAAPSLTTPEASQAASVGQRIGITDIAIAYHAPLARGRKIWGEAVPWNEVWRAGANENTTISFTHAVKVEGVAVPAGTYGLHMIPGEKEWTVILSKNSTSWGSYHYKKEEDAARAKVKPMAFADPQDHLSYEFVDRKAGSAVAMLRWEKLGVPFRVDVEVPAVVIASMKNELRGLAGFSWEPWAEAADYALKNKDLVDAAEWSDRALKMQENFSTLRTKAAVLRAKGKGKDADEIMKKAMPLAGNVEMNLYGYALLADKKTAEAVEIFRLNVSRHPDDWNVYDSLGECLEAAGQKAEAAASYKTALAKAPKDQKARIEAILKRLGG